MKKKIGTILLVGLLLTGCNSVEPQTVEKETKVQEEKSDGKYKEMELGTPVSMNFWGFKPSVIEKLNDVFKNEIVTGVKNNPLKYEALLPNHVGVLVKEGKAKVKIFTSNDSWFGVTYKEDKPKVVAKIQALKDNGTYPDMLFTQK